MPEARYPAPCGCPPSARLRHILGTPWSPAWTPAAVRRRTVRLTILPRVSRHHNGTSFGERDVLDRTPARETREVVGQGSAARKLDGVGDEDDIAAGGVVVSRESKVRGREVQRSLETEGAATVDDVVSGRAAGRDR